MRAEAVCFPAVACAAWYATVTTPAHEDPARTANVQGECVVLLSSRPLQQLPAAAYLAAKRGYWGIENGLHYRLDVSALEDKSRVRNRNNALTLGLFRRLTVSLFYHWVRRVGNVRDATLPSFFDAMDAEGSRRAFCLITAKRSSWLPPP